MNNHDPFKSPRRPWHRKRDPYPSSRGRYDTKFYKRTTWQGVRNAKLWENPFCEVCEAYDHLIDGEHVDHIIPRSKGGSDIDPRNLMTLSAFVHNKKSALERVKGCLVPARDTPSGLIPVRREDIIEVMGKAVYGHLPPEDH